MGEPNGVNGRLTNGHGDENGYSVPSETLKVFKNAVLANPLIAKDLPPEIKEASAPIHVVGSDSPSVPVNYRFAEGIASLKVLEAALVNVLLKRKYGLDPQSATIDTDHAILFVMSSILWTLDPSGLNFSPGSTRSVPELEKYFPSYDKHRRDVSAYRSAATNIYKCADGKYFHTHGSLNPDPTQDSLELPHDFEASNYDEAIKPYMEAMSRIKGQEMDNKYNNTYKQAGTLCYTADEFRASEHGKANSNVGLWEIHDKPNPSQPPSWWPDSPQTGPARPLAGLKVVDLTRIIAAPTVTRSLAELGASVMRCTSPNLPDVNSLHVDLNWGKWNCSINLHDEADREKLRQLIKEADVVVQAYRPGALDKYGFSQDDILKMCENRSTGIIHVRENCYGWNGPWQGRSGWQQISDANTGVSYGFGKAMGIDEPVTPIFPHTDYGTGIAGCCAILLALLRRGQSGGSYCVDIALNYYNTWLVESVGTYPKAVFDKVWSEHGRPVYRYYHNNGYSSSRVMKQLREGEGGKRLFKPEFWEDRGSPAVLGDKKIRVVKPIANWAGAVKLGYNVGARGNGVDAARWPEDLSVETVA